MAAIAAACCCKTSARDLQHSVMVVCWHTLECSRRSSAHAVASTPSGAGPVVCRATASRPATWKLVYCLTTSCKVLLSFTPSQVPVSPSGVVIYSNNHHYPWSPCSQAHQVVPGAHSLTECDHEQCNIFGHYKLC